MIGLIAPGEKTSRFTPLPLVYTGNIRGITYDIGLFLRTYGALHDVSPRVIYVVKSENWLSEVYFSFVFNQ